MNDERWEMLYELLPRLYRQRDERAGHPLRALMAVLDSQRELLEQDMEALYDNWFIETCDTWTIPYIADLLGIEELSLGRFWHPTERRRVANAVAYRRRVGTHTMLQT